MWTANSMNFCNANNFLDEILLIMVDSIGQIITFERRLMNDEIVQEEGDQSVCCCCCVVVVPDVGLAASLTTTEDPRNIG